MGQITEEVGSEAQPIIRSAEGSSAGHQDLARDVDLHSYLSEEGVGGNVTAEQSSPTANHHILEEVSKAHVAAAVLHDRRDLFAQIPLPLAGRHARRIAARDHVAQVEGCLGDIDLGCTGGRIDHRIPIGFLRIDRWRRQRGAEVDARAEVAQRKPRDRLEQKRHVGVQEDGQRSEVAKTHAEENPT